jgi:branched-chain amino acid aminotransferase
VNVNKEIVWFDGRLMPADKALVPLRTHALHYGTSVFEGIRCYETKSGKPAIFRLPEHIERLYFSASVLGVTIPFSKEDIRQAIKDTIKANGLKECYIRPIIFIGDGPLGVSAKNPVHCAIIVQPWGKYFDKGAISVRITNLQRLHPCSANMSAKVGGHYFNSVMANNEAHAFGADEALLLDHNNLVAEGAGQNIFLVHHDIYKLRIVLHTPNLGNILPGITRDSVIELANRELHVETREMNIRPLELIAPETLELFFCGTAVEICPIAKINEISVANGQTGEFTLQLKELYQKVVHGEIPYYDHWLDYIE